jgi:hypothetical protein
MPEQPDIAAYLGALESRIVGQPVYLTVAVLCELISEMKFGSSGVDIAGTPVLHKNKRSAAN